MIKKIKIKKRIFHAEIHKGLISFISTLDRHILCKKQRQTNKNKGIHSTNKYVVPNIKYFPHRYHPSRINHYTRTL